MFPRKLNRPTENLVTLLIQVQAQRTRAVLFKKEKNKNNHREHRGTILKKITLSHPTRRRLFNTKRNAVIQIYFFPACLGPYAYKTLLTFRVGAR